MKKIIRKIGFGYLNESRKLNLKENLIKIDKENVNRLVFNLSGNFPIY